MSGNLPGFKKFVSSDELDEARRLRQEEWEKVRKTEDPKEAPEEPYDSRCLYDKLEQQKQKKQDELDQKHRFSNQVKVLDDDEADFLDFVSEQQEEINRRREAEDTEVLAEYREAMMNQATSAATTSAVNRPQSSTQRTSPSTQRTSSSTKKSQLTLLAGVVKRKSTDTTSAETSEKKSKLEPSRTDDLTESPANTPQSEHDTAQDPGEPIRSQTAHVIGVLPGLGAYSGSSESDSSSDSDLELPPDIFQCKKIILAHNQIG